MWLYTGCQSGDELVKMKERITEMGGSDNEASKSFQLVEETHTTNTASRDSDHDKTEDLSADVPEVSASISSELFTENPSSEENTPSGEKSGK